MENNFDLTAALFENMTIEELQEAQKKIRDVLKEKRKKITLSEIRDGDAKIRINYDENGDPNSFSFLVKNLYSDSFITVISVDKDMPYEGSPLHGNKSSFIARIRALVESTNKIVDEFESKKNSGKYPYNS